MTEASKVTRVDIQIGSFTVDGFRLQDGSYRMSQTQVAQCIGDDTVYARNFLTSKALKSLRGEGYTPETFEVDSAVQSRGQTRIQGWPLEVVYAYWVYRCFKGSSQAFALVIALGTESLERRFDAAFGVTQSEEDYNDRTTDRIQQLEQSLEKLGEAYAEDDLIRQERDRFLQLLQSAGIDPYALPQLEQENQ